MSETLPNNGEQSTLLREIVACAEEVELHAISKGYVELFEIAAEVLRSVTQLLQIKYTARLIMTETKKYPTAISVAESIGITRNALYHRVDTLDFSMNEVINPDKHVEDLIHQSREFYRLIEILKEAVHQHDIKLKKPFPPLSEPPLKPLITRKSKLAEASREMPELFDEL